MESFLVCCLSSSVVLIIYSTLFSVGEMCGQLLRHMVMENGQMLEKTRTELECDVFSMFWMVKRAQVAEQASTYQKVFGFAAHAELPVCE